MTKVFFREAIARAVREEMLRDERVIVLGQDVAEFGGAGLSVEPSGAVATAALLAGRIASTPGPLVIVLSGGNVDPDFYADLVR